jgi:hypothetical protein
MLQHVGNAPPSLQDDLISDSTALEVVPLYLDRDIAHMLERFVHQMEAHEGFVQHCMSRNASSHCFYPGLAAIPVCIRVEHNAQMMQRRLRRLIKKVSNISIAVLALFFGPGATRQTVNVADQMHNRVANQQARFASRQAEHSTEMARLQRLDTQIALEQGRGVARLSFIATIFVPLSFAAVGPGLFTQCLHLSHATWRSRLCSAWTPLDHCGSTLQLQYPAQCSLSPSLLLWISRHRKPPFNLFPSTSMAFAISPADKLNCDLMEKLEEV